MALVSGCLVVGEVVWAYHDFDVLTTQCLWCVLLSVYY